MELKQYFNNRYTNKIYCKSGDIIDLKYSSSIKYLFIEFFNDNDEFISSKVADNASVLRETAPENTSYIRFGIQVEDGALISHDTAGKTIVYVNNAIDSLKNDLSTKLNVVKFDEETTSYEIPTPRNYGTVIVMTAYDIYSLIYESGGAVKHQKLTSFYENKSISSASFSNTDRKITITFNNIMWGGIKAIFQ